MPDLQKKTNQNVAIGVEISRNRATFALVDHHGRIHHRCFAKTLWGRPAVATLEPYLRALESMFVYAKSEGLFVCGLGVSIPGILDLVARRPQTIPVLPSLNGFPLSDVLETRYNLPVQLQVDVDAALLGEYHFGAGKGFRRSLFLNVSAVVGASLIVDGKLEHSVQECIGHVCHMLISTNGPRCSCGKRGCINTLISTGAVQKMVQRTLRHGVQSSLVHRLNGREYFSKQLLAEEALRGDSAALQIYSEVGRWLGVAIAKYIQIFEPDVLILGGNALHADELLIAHVRSSLMAQSLSKLCNAFEMVPSHLGSDATLIGAVVPFWN